MMLGPESPFGLWLRDQLGETGATVFMVALSLAILLICSLVAIRILASL